MIARRGAVAAAGHAVAAVVPEGQPGRSAGALPDAQLDDDAAVAGRRVRRNGARAAALDGQRRRRVNVFGAQKFAVRIDVDPDAARLAPDRHRPGRAGGLHGERQPADRHALRPAAQLRRPDQRPADGCRRRTGRLSSPTATAARSGSAKSPTSTTASRTRATPAGSTARRPSISRSSVSPAPTRSRSSTRSRQLLPQLQAQLPAALELGIRSDRSVSIRESVDDVKFTLHADGLPRRARHLPVPAGTCRRRSSPASRCRSRSSARSR